jgi:hypothetical protein
LRLLRLRRLRGVQLRQRLLLITASALACVTVRRDTPGVSRRTVTVFPAAPPSSCRPGDQPRFPRRALIHRGPARDDVGDGHNSCWCEPAVGRYGASAAVFGKPAKIRRGPRHCDRGTNLDLPLDASKASGKAKASDDPEARRPAAALTTFHEEWKAGFALTTHAWTPSQGTLRPRPSAIRIPIWGWATAIVALVVVYLLLQENGAVLAERAVWLHEFTHDGRHALGAPCH